jgi:hypothetical protein
MRAKISVREEDRTLHLLAAGLTNREIGQAARVVSRWEKIRSDLYAKVEELRRLAELAVSAAGANRLAGSYQDIDTKLINYREALKKTLQRLRNASVLMSSSSGMWRWQIRAKPHTKRPHNSWM